jgi:transmembrane sensor
MDERDLHSPPELLPVREAEWHRERSRAALLAVHQRVRRARLVRRVQGAALVAACALLAFAFWPRESNAPVAQHVPSLPSNVAPTVKDGRVLRFADASTVTLLDAASEVEVLEVTPERVEVSLTRGQAAFSVTPLASRTFVVRVATLALEVLGTRFTVEREAERVLVSVSEGRVEVTSLPERRLLVAKESAWFALTKAPSPAAMPEPPTNVESGEKASTRHEGTSAHRAFLEHARHRRYTNVMELIREKPSVVHDDPEDLMLAADAARLTGHAEKAVPYLKRVVQEHAKDPRAQLAAFTLGRILLFDLNRPLEARAAFALTRKISAQGALAEDALAREVQAAEKAGQRSEARTLAQEYLTRYPEGRRRGEVAAFAEPP